MSYPSRKILEFLFGKDKMRMLSPTLGVVSSSKKRVFYNIGVSDLNKDVFTRTVWKLRRSKLLEFKEDGHGFVRAVLTETGKRRILSYRFEDMEINKPKRWDGKWRIVAFDIPENKKAARNALGGKMKSMGLLPFQKSLWIYPYECQNEIDFIAEIFEVGRYVHYIVTHSITNDDLLKKRFNIKS